MPNLIRAFSNLFRALALVLLLAPAARPQGHDPVAVFLTWRGDPTSSVTVDWHLLPGTDAPRVEIRGPGLDGWVAREGERFGFPFSDRSVRRADLTGLRPDATYEIRFGEGSRSYRYRTLPARLTRPVRFAAGGDTQAADSTFGHMNRLVTEHDLDFVLFGGDLAYANGDPRNVRREETWFETITKSLITPDRRLIPVVVAIGNHEVFSTSGFATPAAADSVTKKYGVSHGDSPYYSALIAMPRNHRYGVVDFGDYLSVLLLNSDHTAEVPGEQTRWLASTLEERRDRPYVFPIYHVPAYPSVRAFEGRTSQRIRESWVPLFERYRLPISFENHDHLYKRSFPLLSGKRHPAGIVYVGDGAWGVNPREIGRDQGGKKPWYLTEARSINHAIIVTLDPTKAELRVIDGTQRIIDEHTARPRSAPPVTSAR